MAAIDFSHLSSQDRLDLIEALWDSLDTQAVMLSDSQEREIDSRLARLDANPKEGRDAFDILAKLRNHPH